MPEIAPPGTRPALVVSLLRGLRLRCPRCGQGPLLRPGFHMRRECAVCGLDYFREPGYYVGAMMINYAVTVVLILAVYLLSTLLPEIWHASSDMKILVWMAVAVVISISLVPLSRGLWLAVDYWVEPWM